MKNSHKKQTYSGDFVRLMIRYLPSATFSLPRMIKFSDGGKHVYTYDASGRKLRAEHHVPIMVAAEPQVLVDEQLLLPMGLDTFEDEPQEAQPEELSGAEWEMPWDEFAAQAAPFICIMPPQPPDDEIIIDWPMPDDQLIEDEVPCDVTAIDYCGNFIYEDGALRRILIPGGYVTFANNNINQPEYNCYLTDYQGNVRMVVDQSVNTKQIYHYYPYGGLMGGKEFPYSGIVNSIYGDLQPYKYNGKELDRHSGLDWYDYGARWYNGISWMTPDPLAEKYYDTSPYVYCANNPLNAIDPDGKKIVLVNGKIGFGSPAAGAAYWNGANSSFVQGAKSFFKDQNVFFSTEDYGYFSSAKERAESGYDYAKTHYDQWIYGMDKDETFKLVSHSMGGAFSKGIERYIKEQGREVEYNVMINTYQVDRIQNEVDSKTIYVDYQNTNDPVLFWFDVNLGRGELQNANIKIREKSNESTMHIHRSPIDMGDFWKTIEESMKNSFKNLK